MKTNKNGKYDVLNLSTGEWFGANTEWLDGINLDNASDIRFRNEHGTNEVLETIDNNGTSSYYDN
jgi:hypothetical protein